MLGEEMLGAPSARRLISYQRALRMARGRLPKILCDDGSSQYPLQAAEIPTRGSSRPAANGKRLLGTFS